MRSIGSPLAVSISTGTWPMLAGQGAHAAAHFQSVHVGQHQVQDHQVRVGAGGRVLQ